MKATERRRSALRSMMAQLEAALDAADDLEEYLLSARISAALETARLADGPPSSRSNPDPLRPGT